MDDRVSCGEGGFRSGQLHYSSPPGGHLRGAPDISTEVALPVGVDFCISGRVTVIDQPMKMLVAELVVPGAMSVFLQ